MKHLFFRISLCCMALAAGASCEKVSSLSDSAKVERIEITACDPSQVVFDDPILNGNTIELPLVYGKYLFPFSLSFNVTTEAGCTQLLGFDKGQTLAFDNIAHERKFYTVAASGATTTWVIRIVDAMSSESAEVVRAEATTSTESGILVAPVAIVDKFKGHVTFQGTGAETYPMTVSAAVTLAEGATFTTEFPETLTFESEEDVKKYTVESASGRTKEWTFKTDFVDSNANADASKLSEDQVRRLTLLADQAVFSSEEADLVEIRGRFKSSSAKLSGEIDFMVSPIAGGGSLAFPLKARITLPADKQAVLFGTPADGLYEFSGYADQKQVWVADKVSGIIKCWTVVLCPEMNTDVKSYDISTWTCKGIPNILVDKDNVEIDNENSRIIIPVAKPDGSAIPEDLNPKLELKINMTIGLYDGSKCTTKSTSHTNITNTGSLNVTTENGIQKRSWTVFLKDKNAAKSSSKEVANMSIVEYSSKGDRMKLSSASYVADNDTKTISLKITEGLDAFPLVISQKVIKPTKGTTKILPTTIAAYDEPIVFESLNSVKDFAVQAEDGSTEDWKILLTTALTGKTTDIEKVLITNTSNNAQPMEVKINKELRNISIVIEGTAPLDFKAQFTTSDNAVVSGIENDILTFNSYADRIPVTVTSEDSSLSNTWTITIERPTQVQIGNSSFEDWGTFKDINNNTFTIDPAPGVGYGWGTANLTMIGIGVTGTLPLDRADGTKAAEMTTAEQNTVMKGYVMAAGTLYTGQFVFNFSHIAAPRKMTKFGIPFSARPSSFDMELKYNAGPQLKQATADAKGKYSIHNINGVDQAHVWIELLRWTGEGSIDYDGNPSEKITVIGRSELVIDGTDTRYNDWTKVNLPMNYNAQNAIVEPTHLVVVFSSSKRGDEFIGATGSKFCADNFHINY